MFIFTFLREHPTAVFFAGRLFPRTSAYRSPHIHTAPWMKHPAKCFQMIIPRSHVCISIMSPPPRMALGLISIPGRGRVWAGGLGGT